MRAAQSAPVLAPRLRPLILGILVLSQLIAIKADASCVESLSTTGQFGDLVLVTGISGTEIETAISYWTICPGYGSGFPTFTSDSGTEPVDVWVGVHYHPDQTNSSCGSYDPDTQTIHLYDKGLTAQGSEYHCDRTDTLAHELGHVLGLANSSCSGYMMGPPPLFLQNGEYFAGTRSPQGGECSEADMNWLTPTEHEEVDKDDPREDGPCAK